MRVPLPVIASLCMTTSLVLADDEVTRAKSPSQSPRLAVQHAEFFEARIRPILSEYCVSCHGPRKQQSGLRLDSQEGLLKGTDGGPVVVQGRPDESAMIKAIRHDAAIKMPPRSKLPAQAITDLTTWVQIGAPWPDNTVEHSAGGAGGPATTISANATTHWAFQKIKESSRTCRQEYCLAPNYHRLFYPGAARRARSITVAASRQADLDPPRDVRFDGSPSYSRRCRVIRCR